MRFDLSDEQKHLQHSVDRVLSDLIELPALASRPEGFAALEDRVDAALGEVGVQLAMVPEKHGGLEMGLLTLAVIAQSLGRQCAPSAILEAGLGAWAISELGADPQRERWLPGLLSGETSVTFALSGEPGNWAPETWPLPVTEGSACRVNVRPLSRPGLAIVGTAEGLFLAPVSSQSFDTCSAPLDGSRPLGTLTLNVEQLDPLCGMAEAWRVYEALLVLAAADAAGAGQRALEMSVEYAMTREQFGQAIGTFQAVKHQLANMAVDISPAHFSCWFAAHSWDRSEEETRRLVLIAKAHATDMAVKTARAAVECHGGIAYTSEYPLHLLLKRSMQDRVTLGDPASLRRMVAQIDDAGAA